MGPWVLAVVAAAVVAALAVGVVTRRAASRTRAELQAELVAARGDVHALTERVETLAAEVETARRAVAEQARRRQVEPFEGSQAPPFVITGLVDVHDGEPPREAQLVHAIEAGRPVWVPAKPLHEVLVRTVSLGHGVRLALSSEKRDRIMLEMRAEVRRSRRQRKAEMKAVRKYLRQRRKSAA